MNLIEIAEKGRSIVKKASLVAKDAQNRLVKDTIVSKQDLSPVTVIDYAVQASIAIYLQKHILHTTFRMIAEEDSQFLRQESSKAYLQQVVWYVNQILDPLQVTWEEVLDVLDQCHYEGDPNADYWILDPIDGTKGFISNAQFAIGLAFVHQGIPVVGIVGCPNFPYHPMDPQQIQWNENISNVGSLCVGIRGQDAILYDLFSDAHRIIHTALSPTSFSAVISKQPINHTSTLCQLLNACGYPQTVLEMDSMCKYLVVACGYAHMYLRECIHSDYRENVWDHAAGSIIVECTGGIVTDLRGKQLQFCHGGKLEDNYGILASVSSEHSALIRVVSTICFK